MYAVVIAGGIPRPTDPLYSYSQGKPKALIDINGRPMLEWVVDGLYEAPSVEHVVVVGIDEADRPGLNFARPVTFLPNQGGMIPNVKAGLLWVRQNAPQETVALASSADIPHLRGPMVEELLNQCRPFDHMVYYTFATPAVIENRYPDSRRTYVKFKGGVQVAGADLFVVQIAVVDTNQQLWEAVTNARKNAWQIARLVGIGTLLKMVFRQLSLDEVPGIAGRMLGAPVKVILTNHAELAMDGDKPNQIELLRATMSR